MCGAPAEGLPLQRTSAGKFTPARQERHNPLPLVNADATVDWTSDTFNSEQWKALGKCLT